MAGIHRAAGSRRSRPRSLPSENKAQAELCRALVPYQLIEQNAKQALQISDYGLVLEQGRTRIDADAAEVLADPRIAQLFLGGGLAPVERAS
jgi:ABC-type branched-subunit amino acid transport system ATPase component